MKIFVSHLSKYDFKKLLYEPLRNSQLNKDHKIFLPHEDGKNILTMNIIKKSDLLVAEVSFPSTGQGFEIGWAYAFKVPIIAIYKKGHKTNNSIKFLTETILEYNNADDMIEKLTAEINSVEDNIN